MSNFYLPYLPYAHTPLDLVHQTRKTAPCYQKHATGLFLHVPVGRVTTSLKHISPPWAAGHRVCNTRGSVPVPPTTAICACATLCLKILVATAWGDAFISPISWHAIHDACIPACYTTHTRAHPVRQLTARWHQGTPYGLSATVAVTVASLGDGHWNLGVS